jgi:hypothetical protein
MRCLPGKRPFGPGGISRQTASRQGAVPVRSRESLGVMPFSFPEPGRSVLSTGWQNGAPLVQRAIPCSGLPYCFDGQTGGWSKRPFAALGSGRCRG